MRVLICGDRNWTDYEPISYALDELSMAFDSPTQELELVEGEARGADTIARIAAERQGILVHKFPADWATLGLAAGIVRNQQMLDDGKPDLVLAFHDHLNFSKGTRDMIHRAQAADLHVILYTHEHGFRSLPKCFR